ncbi:MAG: hypothetical protein GX758_01905, partial [Tenericutes bacterium]|nr:hypothetical protein [Mycoplasmatota bacterium]
MENEKKLQIKRILNILFKIISYISFVLLFLIGILLIVYVITNKIAEKEDKKAPFLLYT